MSVAHVTCMAMQVGVGLGRELAGNGAVLFLLAKTPKPDGVTCPCVLCLSSRTGEAPCTIGHGQCQPQREPFLVARGARAVKMVWHCSRYYFPNSLLWA